MVWRFFRKLGIKSPYDPAIPLLGIYLETKMEKDTCIPLFTAALFTIARTWKQPRCPTTDEWIKCGTYTQWNIKSEVSQKQKDKYCILTHLYGNQKKKMVLNNLVTGQQWKNRHRE